MLLGDTVRLLRTANADLFATQRAHDVGTSSLSAYDQPNLNPI